MNLIVYIIDFTVLLDFADKMALFYFEYTSECACRTHPVFLPFIMYGKNFVDAVVSRFYNFAVNCLYCTNTHALLIACNARCSSLSSFGKNLMRLQMSESEVSISSPDVNLMCELVFCRSGYFHSVLSDAETEFMLRDRCCN